MPRIRSVHPGQWTDEAFVSVSLAARLLAVAVRNIADDHGVFDWKPITLKMQLFPADAVDVGALLAELADTGQIVAFEANGKKYGAIRNFRKWQRPEKPKPVHPLPDDLRLFVGLPAIVNGGGGDNPPAGEGRTESEQESVDDRSPTNRGEVADPSPTCGAEEGGRREEEGSSSPSLRSGAAPSAASQGEVAVANDTPAEKGERTVRDDLFDPGDQGGVAIIRRLTGRAEKPARGFIGKVLGVLGDDAAAALALIREADRRCKNPHERLADPASWISANAKARAEAITNGHAVPMKSADAPKPGTPEWHRQEAEARKARALARQGNLPAARGPIIEGEAEPAEARA